MMQTMQEMLPSVLLVLQPYYNRFLLLLHFLFGWMVSNMYCSPTHAFAVFLRAGIDKMYKYAYDERECGRKRSVMAK